MGAVIALMVWLYWTSFFMLLGAEINCQLAKETTKGKIKQDETPSGLTGVGSGGIGAISNQQMDGN